MDEGHAKHQALPPPVTGHDPLRSLVTGHAFCFMTPMTGKDRRYLRGLAHAMNPVVNVGKGGVSDAVVRQVDGALTDHELIKVKVRGAERAARYAMLAQLADATGSALVPRIGHVAVLYRPRPGAAGILIPDP